MSARGEELIPLSTIQNILVLLDARFGVRLLFFTSPTAQRYFLLSLAPLLP